VNNASEHETAHPKDPTQLPPNKSDKKGIDRKPSHPKTGTGRAWHIATRTSQIIGTVIASLAAILGIATGYLALLPRVSVSRNEQLDPSNTFSSPFIISNDGPLPMENVRFTCGIVDVKHENGPEILGDINFGTAFFVLKDKNGNPAVMNFGSREMMPGERSTMPSCSYPYLNPIERANIGIVVDFRLGYTPFETKRIFRFGTLKDSSGKLHWFPLPVK